MAEAGTAWIDLPRAYRSLVDVNRWMAACLQGAQLDASSFTLQLVLDRIHAAKAKTSIFFQGYNQDAVWREVSA
jgi:hypothetical protein